MKFLNRFRVGILILTMVLNANLFAQDQERSFVENLNIHGFLSQGFMMSSDNNYLGKTRDGSFQFNEIGLNFSTMIFDDLRIGAQLLSRDLGREGNHAVIIDWAFADYSFQDWLGIRAGKIKMPLGLYNEYRDLDVARTSIFLPQGGYVESWRESFTALTGVGLYGAFNTEAFGDFNYQLQAGVIDINNNTGLDWTIEDELDANLNKYEVKPSYVTSILWDTPVEGLKVGASTWNTKELKGKGSTPDIRIWQNRSIGAAQEIAAFANANLGQSLPMPSTYDEALAIFAGTGIDMNLVGIPMVQTISNVKANWYSVEYTYGDFILAYEKFNMDTQLKTTSPGYGADLLALDPTLPSMEVLSDFSSELGGYYFSLGYQISDQISVLGYHSEFYTDMTDYSSNGGRFIDTELSLRYDYNSHLTLKTELHSIGGLAIMYDGDQDPSDVLKKDWYLFATKVTFNF